MHPSPPSSLLIAASLCAASSMAWSQGFDSVRLPGSTATSGGVAGLAVVAGPEYQGSDERRVLAVPLLAYRSSSGWFAGTTQGLGYLLSSTDDLQYGVRLTADFGRKSRRSAALEGMRDIDAAPELGAFVNWSVDRHLQLNGSIRYGAGHDHNGVKLDVGAQYGWLLNPLWRAGLGVGASFGNGNWVQDQFGVLASESTATRPAYSAGAGLTEVKASASLNWSVTPQWSAFAAVGIGSLQGDAKRSPLVRDRTPVGGAIGVARSF